MESENYIKNFSQNFSSNEESPETDGSKDSIDFNENLSFFNEGQAKEINEEPKKMNVNRESKRFKKDIFGKNGNITEINKINLSNNENNNLILKTNKNVFSPFLNTQNSEFNQDLFNKNILNNIIKSNRYNNNDITDTQIQKLNQIQYMNNININNINLENFFQSYSDNINNNNNDIDLSYRKAKKNCKSKKRSNNFNNEIINFNIFIENLNTPLDAFICSQTGSRMLQNNLNNFSNQIIDLLIDKIKLYFEKLMCDVYGNYFCQKLYIKSTFKQRLLILDSIKDSFISISKTKSGSHVAQSLIEQSITSEEKMKIMNFMKNYELEMALDNEGTHVLQKIIQIFPEGERQSLTDVLCKSENVNILCKDLKGISVIKRLICFNNEENNRIKLVNAIYDSCLEIVKTSSGSYILQFLLEEWGINTGIKLIFFSINHFEFFACHKHGVNFINKIIILCLKKLSLNKYAQNSTNNIILIKTALIIINALKNLIFDFNKIVNVYKYKCAKLLIFNIRKLFNNAENEKLFLYIKSLESLSNTFENKKYRIYLEIYKSHSITL